MARITAAILLIITVTALTSCSLIKINLPTPEKTAEPTAEPTETADATATESADDGKTAADYLAELPEAKYGGADFTVVSSSAKDVLFDDGNTVYSSEVAKRNKTVSEKYEISFIEITADKTMMRAEVANAIAAGTYYADLIAFPSDTFGAYYAEGSLLNLRSVPFFDTSADYFNASSVRAATIGGRTYAVAGDATTDRDSLSCIYYNKAISAEIGLADAYAVYKSGKWTLEYFIAKTASVSDYNTVRMLTGLAPVSSYANGADGSIADTVFASSALTYVECDGALALSDSLLDGSALLDKIRQLGKAEYVCDANGEVAFAAGEVAFMFGTLSEAAALADSKYDWGILPIPTASGRYGTYLSADKATLFGIPKKTANPEMSGVILSALNAASYGVLDEAYLTNMLDYYLRDNGSANAVKAILSSPIYDAGAFLSSEYGEVKKATADVVDAYFSGTVIAFGDRQSRIDEVRRVLDALSK